MAGAPEKNDLAEALEKEIRNFRFMVGRMEKIAEELRKNNEGAVQTAQIAE